MTTRRKPTIACLQFAPFLGKVQHNIDRADEILARDMTDNIDWLVLPEMAFTGYHFRDSEHIRPYLEPTAAGLSAEWARRTAIRYKCLVTVGYPETSRPSLTLSDNAVTVLGDLLLLPQVTECLPYLSNLPISSMEDLKSDLTGMTKQSDTTAAQFLSLCNAASLGQHDLEDHVQTASSLSYNSTLTVDPHGSVVWHYRKSHLYYTDVTWAEEGPGRRSHALDRILRTTSPKWTPNHQIFDLYLDSDLQPDTSEYSAQQRFPTCDLPGLGKCSTGICMDINPYKFEASYAAHEFANAAVQAGSVHTCISMAWTSHLLWEDMLEQPDQPDVQTVLYWAERFEPIREATKGTGAEGDKIVVCANRCGAEGATVYAGSSTVFRFSDGECYILGMTGRNEEGLLIVSTDQV